MAIGMTLSTVAVMNEDYVNMQSRSYKSLLNNNKKYYEVTDYLRGEMEEAFFADERADNIIKEYIEAMEKSERYPYYHYGSHGIRMEKKLPDSFDEYYDIPSMRDPETQQLRAKQINQRVIIDYPLRITFGRGFAHDDFQYKEGKPIPVLMGADYEEHFTIGETVDAQCFGVDIQIEVIGFIHPDDYFPFNHIFQYENKSIIMPMLHFPETIDDEKDNLFKQRSYLQYVNGIFALEEDQSFAALFHHVNSMKDQYGMFDVIFMELDLQQAQLLGLSANKQIQVIRTICILTFVLSFIMVFISSVSLQKVNRRRYAILYMCGASRGNLISYILGQQLFTAFVACWMHLFLLDIGITGEGGTPNVGVIFLAFFFSAVATMFSVKDMYGKKALHITKEGNEYGK